MEKLIAISKNVIVIRDLNLNMICYTDFTTVCNSFDLVNLVTYPTRFKGSPSILEVILVNNPRRFKGTHTVYFSSSLYIINQKPMIPRTDFHCITTWVARSSG